MTKAEEDALMDELLHLFAVRLERAGLGLADEAVGRILGSMLAGHYAIAGGDRYVLTEWLHERLDLVDEARRGMRHDIPGVKR